MTLKGPNRNLRSPTDPPARARQIDAAASRRAESPDDKDRSHLLPTYTLGARSKAVDHTGHLYVTSGPDVSGAQRRGGPSSQQLSNATPALLPARPARFTPCCKPPQCTMEGGSERSCASGQSTPAGMSLALLSMWPQGEISYPNLDLYPGLFSQVTPEDT
ncbi:unnamed protein product [Pleuronectes platessa]|uniref:Uncharacterized protein n=1 Tax=Pleuronectes platessa TaxID=8262 RepID=A0A9N7U689_PLEPL|nr:unnamed protein product [Pleuronectes platessa]